MSYASWPAVFGIPQRSDYSVSGSLPVVRTTMENGRPRAHRVAKTIMRAVQVSIVLNSAEQCDNFFRFFEDEGNAGANWFYMPIQTASNVANHLVQFTSYPALLPIRKGRYKVSFTVQTDQQILS